MVDRSNVAGLITETISIALLTTLAGMALGGLFLLIKGKAAPRWTGIVLLGEAVVFCVLFVVLSSEVVLSNPPLAVSLRELVSQLPALLGVFLAGAGLYALCSTTRSKGADDPLRRSWLWLTGSTAVFAILLIIGVGISPSVETALAPPTPEISPTTTPESAEARVALSLPPGFRIEATIDPGTFTQPTSMAIGQRGELYVGHTQGIDVVWDTDGDGAHDVVQRFSSEVQNAFGLAYQDGALYTASEGRVIRLEDRDGDRSADFLEVLHDGLPHGAYDGHGSNGIAFDRDGKLYLAQGGTSDHGPETEPLAGSILMSNLEGGPLEVFARGLRNPYDLAFCNGDTLFATDNGPDQVEDETLVYTPPDELNLIVEGGDFGYPEVFGHPPSWSDSIGPIAQLPAHGAATGIECYDGDQFPAEFRGDLLITMWNARLLIHVDLQSQIGQTVGAVDYFATDWDRPIDLVVDLDGSLLVLDWNLGQIFRVSYSG